MKQKKGLVLLIVGVISTANPAQGALSAIKDYICTMPTGVVAACGAVLGNTIGYYARNYQEVLMGQDLHPVIKEQAKSVMLKYGSKHLSKSKIDQIVLKRSGWSGFSVWSTKSKPVMYIDDCCYDNSHFKIGVLHEMGHIYYRDTYRDFLKMQLFGIGIPISMELTQSLSFGLMGLVGAAVCLRLGSLQAERKADQFAIDCLKSQKDLKTLQAGACYYDARHKYFGGQSKLLTKIGFSDRAFKKMKLNYPLIAKSIQLIDDEHPTDQDRAAKFRQAAQELAAWELKE